MHIRTAESAEDLEVVRRLFREYQTSLGVDLCFQNFESELTGLPGKYAPPEGRLYLAFEDEHVVGCAGLRKIEEGICELKRLYVPSPYRGRGIGRQLAVQAVNDAREIGYGRMRLDTLPSMGRAQELYRTLGFKPIEPYTNNPIEGTLFFELTLRQE
ncbi:MAG TPA: GNAT family N-acetyltransferase [Terriglobia bacterium]|nr:GNAT family N-acetyltransferase [Terriglobia bacterium]